jgi:hypothetical protein
MKSNDVSHISHQYHEALRAYVDPVALGMDLQPALQLGTLAVDAGLDTLDMARIHDLAMNGDRPCGGRRRSLRLRASAFFAEAITPIESTHRSAQEAKQKIERLSDTLALSSVELAEIQMALRDGISMREGSEAALKSSRDTFENSAQRVPDDRGSPAGHRPPIPHWPGRGEATAQPATA